MLYHFFNWVFTYFPSKSEIIREVPQRFEYSIVYQQNNEQLILSVYCTPEELVATKESLADIGVCILKDDDINLDTTEGGEDYRPEIHIAEIPSYESHLAKNSNMDYSYFSPIYESDHEEQPKQAIEKKEKSFASILKG